MIIFYDKETGEVVGTIEGRKHSKDVLEKVWIGDKKKIGRKIVEWERTGKEKIKEYTEKIQEPIGETIEGFPMFKEIIVKKRKKIKEYEPDCEQPSLLKKIEKGSEDIYSYKIKNEKLIKK